MTASSWIFDRAIPMLNTAGALWAIRWRITAARVGTPGWASMHLAVAGLAAFFGIAYATLWLGIVDDRASWSRYVALASAASWVLAWGWPARRQVRGRSGHARR